MKKIQDMKMDNMKKKERVLEIAVVCSYVVCLLVFIAYVLK